MRKVLTIMALVLTTIAAQAKEAVYIKLTTGETIVESLTNITQMKFSADATTLSVNVNGTENVITASTIDEITYGDIQSAVSVIFNGTSATVVNPYHFEGMAVSFDGAYVTITNTDEATERKISLSGNTSDGAFTYNGTYKTTIILDGVSITSTKGAAIDIECGKRIALNLVSGTENTLVDAAGGSQKAALYCKGHLEIDKDGTLNVTGNTKHAISAKEYLQIKKANGFINILGAKGDGIHCGQYFLAKDGYTVTIKNCDDDCIQAEMKSLDEGETYEEDYPNGSINILGSTFNITSTQNGGIETDSESSDDTTAKSYKVYVAKTTGTSGGWGGQQGGNYWNNIYLYKSDGTKVAQLTNTTTITGSNGQALQFYYYDFKQSDSETYYFKSDDYTSRGGSGTFAIVSSNFTGPTSGIDYYYQISSSYTTSGSTRTFALSSVQDIYGGGTSDAEGDTYNSTCLKADSLINISGGTLTLNNSGSMSKSIKAGNSETPGTVNISGGDITCNISGDMYLSGTDATYCTAIKTDTYNGTGGNITINASTGKACHGISADEAVNISDGTYTITNSCAGYLGSNDGYTAKGISCDKNITITGGSFNIKMTGTGGKCIKADGEMTFGEANSTAGPTIVASTSGSMLGSSSEGGMGGGPGGMGGQTTSTSSSSKAIKAEGQITVNSGSLTVTTSTDGAEGLESKTSVTFNGGNHYFHCYDDCINSAGVIKFAGGNTVCWGYGNDAVDSNYGKSGAITISGGNVFAYSTKGSPEEGLDCDNNSYITVTGGIAVSAGAAQGGGMGGSSSSIGSSSQGYYIGSSPSSYSTSYYYTLCNTSGTPMCTYKFEANCSNTLGLLTATNLGKGSVTVKYGTAAPTECDSQVNNAAGNGVFFINPTVTTTGTSVTVTSK